MQLSNHQSEASRPFLAWQVIIDWAQSHYRDRLFRKDELIPTRPGLLYLVHKGAVRLSGIAQIQFDNSSQNESVDGFAEDTAEDSQEEAFLSFIGAGQPFEIVSQYPFQVQAYAHIDRTKVIWLYWHDLDNWSHFKKEVLEAFRYQHQRKLLWLSALGQKKTIERLIGFLTLLVEEYGEPYERGYRLPYVLTHAQIGSAIGSTRVTVTRLMGKLKRQGLITIQEDNFICMSYLPTFLPENF